GGLNLGVVKLGAEGSVSGDLRHSTGSSRGIQNSDSHSQDMRHDQNSQAVNDFRQGMDMVKSSRITDGANHSENAASSNVQQLAATLNDAESQYHQYTTSSTQSSEFSRMATVAQNQSASLDTNYTQEFVDWAANKYGDKAQSMLTSAPSAREAAMEFVNERLKPEIMGDYQQGRSDLTSGQEHAAFSGEHIVQPAGGSQQVSGSSGHDAGVSYSSQNGGAHSSGGVGGEKVRGDAMQESYRENQAKLHEHSTQDFGPQNELQRRVAEQRSENEHKINESAGEIDKKQSTVQASSDILKGENLNATGNFKIQRKEAEIDQQTPVIDSAEKRKLEEQLLELRKRAG
ncbi:TPA: conjugal transfer protein TraG, partial [Enterobacter hormaechei subsp. hoffmannii]|nr:conjugal transfer protein TraG [Enterobacter hormaechei subsp. hoffmannii]